MKINFSKLNKRYIKNTFLKSRGIAMVEALMAITIVIISIMGPIAVSLNAAKYAKYGLYKITATNFANEQIEMLVNYKKSLDIYCFYSQDVAGCDGNIDGFDAFIDNVDGMNCEYNSSLGTSCSFDKSSFAYNLNSKPDIIKKSSCILYTQDNDIAKCDNGETSVTGERSIFSRKMYIDVVDTLKDGSANFENTIRLTSLICLNKPDCNLSSKKSESLILVSYIYR